MMDGIVKAIGRSGLPGAQSLVWRSGVLRAGEDRPFEVPWRGMTYHGNRRFWVDRYIYFLGAYAAAELDFLQNSAAILQPQRQYLTMLDIGANVGQHSLAMAAHFDRILAFEPNSTVAERLKTNILQNSLKNIEVYGVALGEQDETATLGSGLEGNDGSRSLNWSMGAGDEVVVRHAGDFLQGIEPALDRIDVIKLDVEGHERPVLNALSPILLRDRPVILFELVGRETKGGFGSRTMLEAALYPDHQLFALEGRKRAHLVAFDWNRHEEAVCLPAELSVAFRGMM